MVWKVFGLHLDDHVCVDDDHVDDVEDGVDLTPLEDQLLLVELDCLLGLQ